MIPPDNAPASDEVVVTQADRDAAGDWFRGFAGQTLEAECMKEGFSDHWPLVQAFARHRLAASTASVPAGMVLVPVEPTEAMCQALREHRDTGASVRNVWSAMLAASPPPPATTDAAEGLAEAARLGVAYDDLLRAYSGPLPALFENDVPRIDAAYDAWINAARAALAAYRNSLGEG